MPFHPETVSYPNYSLGPRTTLTIGSSPFAFQNDTTTKIMVLLNGGTVSLLEFSRDNSTWDPVGTLLSGDFFLNPGDWMRITYTIAPTGIFYPV
jgi:hypothetical protein